MLNLSFNKECYFVKTMPKKCQFWCNELRTIRETSKSVSMKHPNVRIGDIFTMNP